MIKILFITCSLFLACKPSRKEPVIAGSENPNKQYKADDSTVIDLPSQPQVEPQKIEAEKSLEKHVSIDVNDQKNPPPKESITKTETKVETNTVSNGIPKKDVKTEQKKNGSKNRQQWLQRFNVPHEITSKGFTYFKIFKSNSIG